MDPPVPISLPTGATSLVKSAPRGQSGVGKKAERGCEGTEPDLRRSCGRAPARAGGTRSCK